MQAKAKVIFADSNFDRRLWRSPSPWEWDMKGITDICCNQRWHRQVQVISGSCDDPLHRHGLRQ